MPRPPQRISPVESHLSYWSHYVGYRLFHELRGRTRKFGVTAAESVLLRKLLEHEDGAMPSLLALRLGLSRGYLSRLAMRLEIKGLLHRTKSVSDRRALILTLTDRGRALLSTLSDLADKSNVRHFAGAGEAAQETIERVMKGIVRSNQLRFVPSDRCRMRKYRYPDLIDIDWEENEETDGEGDEDGYDQGHWPPLG